MMNPNPKSLPKLRLYPGVFREAPRRMPSGKLLCDYGTRWCSLIAYESDWDMQSYDTMHSAAHVEKKSTIKIEHNII
jgi:hypothetical protein